MSHLVGLGKMPFPPRGIIWWLWEVGQLEFQRQRAAVGAPRRQDGKIARALNHVLDKVRRVRLTAMPPSQIPPVASPASRGGVASPLSGSR